jgi:hypothetical protein
VKAKYLLMADGGEELGAVLMLNMGPHSFVHSSSWRQAARRRGFSVRSDVMTERERFRLTW